MVINKLHLGEIQYLGHNRLTIVLVKNKRYNSDLRRRPRRNEINIIIVFAPGNLVELWT